MSSDVTVVLTRNSTRREEPIAFISDIHSNLDALSAVMSDIDAQGIRNIVCLGDVVGYGPEPVACWRLVEKRCRIVIRGNHDEALDQTNPVRFHPRAKAAIQWTRKRILQEPGGADLVTAIASTPRLLREKEWMYVHGSPAGPTLNYLLPGEAYDRERMTREFNLVDGIAFNGHTHIPGIIENGEKFIRPESLPDGKYRFTDRKAIINVGSVGQPRDGNPKASYLVVHGDTAVYRRVPYDVEAACEKILAQPELDPFLGRRLLTGY